MRPFLVSLALGSLLPMGCDWIDAGEAQDVKNQSSLAGTQDSTEPECTDCDDGDGCTIDRCVADGCEHEPLVDGATACGDNLTLERCDDGVSSQVDCVETCVAQGYNTYVGCDAETLACLCDIVLFETCVPGAEACVIGNDAIAVCESAADAGTEENVWRAYDCATLCTDAGYGPAVTCGVDLDDASLRVCYCQDLCEPACDAGETCLDGACYESSWPPDDSGDDVACGADWECGYKEACEGGRCIAVECKSDGDCGYCELCQSNYCTYCGTAPDGSCSCY